jgi:transcription elongation factor Elf1
VQCATCGASLQRLIWNYGKNRPITAFFCDNVCKGTWQRQQREALGFTKEWLIDQYVTQAKPANQIAREIGRNAKGVWGWIVSYGIPTRQRGHNVGQLPKDGSTFRGKHHTPESRKAMSELAKASGRVPYDPSVGSYMKGRKGPDTPNWKGGITPERQAFYATDEWREVVKAIWLRANAHCERCGVHHNTAIRRGTFHVHHIVSFKVRELRMVLSNLVLLCKSCHYFVHSAANINSEFIKVEAE